MDNNAEVEKLIAILNNIDVSLSKNRTEISGIKLNISQIKSAILDLKRVYPDLCELEQLDVSIESQNKLLDVETDEDTKSIIQDKIKTFEARKKEIFKTLESMGIKTKEDYDEKMKTLDSKKELISDMEAKVNKKEQENLELIQNRVTIEKKIAELEAEQSKQKDENKGRDLTKTAPKSAKTSELSVFLNYEEEDDEEEPEPEPERPKRVKKVVKKKEDPVDEIITKIVKKQKSISDKFEEIKAECNDEDIVSIMGKLQQKFEDEVCKEIQVVTYGFLRKKMEISDLQEQIKTDTPEAEAKKLEDASADLTNGLQKIENLQQKLEGEVKFTFNEMKEQSINDLNYLKSLRERIVEQTTQIEEKITNIEERLGYLLANSKESLLEQLKQLENMIKEMKQKEQELENKAKDEMIEILDTLKEDIKASESYEDFMNTIDKVKDKISLEEEKIKEEKANMNTELEELESKRSETEEKYNNKTDDKEEESMLLDSKQMLKKDTDELLDMAQVLITKQQEFTDTIKQKKQDIKTDIKQKDAELLSEKEELIKDITYRKKSLPVLLKESIDNYNKVQIREFNMLMDKISKGVGTIETSNDGYKVMTTNMVVLSEFDENTQLLKELQDLIKEGVSMKKDIPNTVEIDETKEKSSVEQEIEHNLSYVDIKDTIYSKIAFEEIVEVEQDVVDIEEIKQSLHGLCEKLDMDDKLSGKPRQKPEPEPIPEPEVEGEEPVQEKVEKVELEQIPVEPKRKKGSFGLEGYTEEEQEVLKDIAWDQLVELKNLNRVYNKILFIDDLKEIQQQKVDKIAELKEEYKGAVEEAKKLYEIKKYVISYKKGMEELANGAKSEDAEDQKEYNKLMKNATKSLKKMKESGISSFEDYRYRVVKNSDKVKQILADTKTENEELVKITGLIQAIENPGELGKEVEKNLE